MFHTGEVFNYWNEGRLIKYVSSKKDQTIELGENLRVRLWQYQTRRPGMSKTTFLDNVFDEKYISWEEGIEQRLKWFLMDNEYDTDSFIQDFITNDMESNIFAIIIEENQDFSTNDSASNWSATFKQHRYIKNRIESQILNDHSMHVLNTFHL